MHRRWRFFCNSNHTFLYDTVLVPVDERRRFTVQPPGCAGTMTATGIITSSYINSGGVICSLSSILGHVLLRCFIRRRGRWEYHSMLLAYGREEDFVVNQTLVMYFLFRARR
jgi:hypothetical protein